MAAERQITPPNRPMESDRGAELAMLMKAAESLLLAASQEREVLDAAMAILGERFGYGTRAMLLFDAQREELSVAPAGHRDDQSTSIGAAGGARGRRARRVARSRRHAPGRGRRGTAAHGRG